MTVVLAAASSVTAVATTSTATVTPVALLPATGGHVAFTVLPLAVVITVLGLAIHPRRNRVRS